MLKVTNIDFFTQKSSLPTYPISQLGLKKIHGATIIDISMQSFDHFFSIFSHIVLLIWKEYTSTL